MAIKTKDELLELISTKFTEDTSDEALQIIEDVTDTMTDLEARASDTTNWKSKYEENDKEWREKYKSRFFDGDSTPEDETPKPEPKTPKTFDDLFTVKEN